MSYLKNHQVKLLVSAGGSLVPPVEKATSIPGSLQQCAARDREIRFSSHCMPGTTLDRNIRTLLLPERDDVFIAGNPKI